MKRVREVLVVEGKCDRNALLRIVDATVICTEGFRIFHDPEKLEMLRLLAARMGVIIMTDPDGAGNLIRGHLSGMIDPQRVKHAYVPDVFGKERRKSSPSKEGKLGVEGMEPGVLLEALRRAGATIDDEPDGRAPGGIAKADLYRLGLSGGPDSASKRRALQRRLGLPEHMSANRLVEVLDLLVTREELEQLTMDNGQ